MLKQNHKELMKRKHVRAAAILHYERGVTTGSPVPAGRMLVPRGIWMKESSEDLVGERHPSCLSPAGVLVSWVSNPLGCCYSSVGVSHL